MTNRRHRPDRKDKRVPHPRHPVPRSYRKPFGGEVLIRNARIIDGSGGPSYYGDVFVEGSGISEIGTGLTPPRNGRIIDADGLALAPGFIDMHAHSDLAVVFDKEHMGKVSQGVTTEVLGQDGLSYAPTTDETMAAIRTQIAGWNGYSDIPELGWRSVAEYLAMIDQEGAAVNAAYLIPQGSLRMMVVGSENRPATADEIWEMRIHVADAMQAGAFGMSSGLTYVPGMFADTAELVELCRVVANFGGYYSPHTRSYGKGALEAYAEMVEVSRQSGCALHLTHATMNFGVNAGRAPELINLINAAIVEGIDVSLDTYPYLAGSTTLSALLPSWSAVGGPEATLERLRDPDVQAQVRYELEVLGTDGCHGVVVDWETIEISGVSNTELSYMVGRTVAQLAADADGDPTSLYFEILQRDRLATTILQHVGHEENVRTMMVHPRHCGGSDGILVGAKPHPRAWGTFPRYLGHYSRDEGLLTLEQAVAHLTSNPASRLGLSRRGLIKRLNFADLVLFDPDTVADRATYENPRTQAEGIHWVFVNGQPVIENGERTDIIPGYALRHSVS